MSKDFWGAVSLFVASIMFFIAFGYGAYILLIANDFVYRAVGSLVAAAGAWGGLVFLWNLTDFIKHKKERRKRFSDMAAARKWSREHEEPIEEWDCPKFDMENPSEKDLEECGIICVNHWACHTFRHLRGTR